MKIKKQFLLFLIVFIAAVITITAAVSILYIHNSFSIIENCTNPKLIPAMAQRMYSKFLISFSFILIFILGITIPVGLLLSKIISEPYLRVIKDLLHIGRKRLSLEENIETPSDDLDTLQNYSTLLVNDFLKIKEYEKVAAWKEGARMLIHEIKNPLTPLKLSSQKLYLSDTLSAKDKNDLKRILTASSDIENILRCFKELVNINFAPKEYFELFDLINEIRSENSNIKIINNSTKNEMIINSERALLKMFTTNLINNGLEANSLEFYIEIIDESEKLLISFITPNRIIEDTSRIFKLGYSSKGNQRGFGLFLCRKISEYLELNLTCINSNRGVEFQISFSKGIE